MDATRKMKGFSMSKLILILLIAILPNYVFSDENLEYTRAPIQSIIEEATRISYEHIKESELDEIQEYETLFQNMNYIISFKIEVSNPFFKADNKGFDAIKRVLQYNNRHESSLLYYSNYMAFGYRDNITIIFIFSDALVDDFNKWVKSGDIVTVYSQLIRYEIKSKTIMFVVNKYEV